MNISRSGVLFVAENELAPETVLEMRIDFPAEVTGDTPAKLVCWGSVVRAIPPDHAGNRPALAATFARYRFGRA